MCLAILKFLDTWLYFLLFKSHANEMKQAISTFFSHFETLGVQKRVL